MARKKRTRAANVSLSTSDSAPARTLRPRKGAKVPRIAKTVTSPRGVRRSSIAPPVLPPPKPGHLSSPQGKLCHRCSSIDLDAIFEKDSWRLVPRDLRPVDNITLNAVDLASVQSWDPTCALCAHFQSDSRFKDGRDSNRRRFWHLSLSQTTSEPQAPRGLRLDHRRSEQIPDYALNGPEDSDVFIIPVQSQADYRSAGYQSCIVGDELDYGLVSKWLRCCDEAHSCKKNRRTGTHAARIIDCETRTLRVHNGEEYVALSYVWGKCTLPTPEEDNLVRTSMKLPKAVPQTIEDAILITRRIGRRYLWVDRYCVDQYHSREKPSQLNAMGDIYNGATLTIVVTMNDADDGIAGVSRERSGQLILESAATKVTSLARSMRAEALHKGIHRQRAWTYQEFQLSVRILALSGTQAFFRCAQENLQEAIAMPAYNMRDTFQDFELSPAQKAALAVAEAEDLIPAIGLMSAIYRLRYKELKKSIIEYSERCMTYGSDALNAFRGVLAKSGLKTYYGHPVHALEDITSTKSVKVTVNEVERDMRGFSRSLLWPGLVNEYQRDNKYASVLEYLEDLQTNPDAVLHDRSFLREPTLPTWSWTASRPISIRWTWEEPDLRTPTFESRYCAFPTIRIAVPSLGEKMLAEAALYIDRIVLPEISPRLIIDDAIVLKGVDIFALARLVSPRELSDKGSTNSAPPSAPDPRFKAWRSPDLSIDPSAGPEMLEIITGEANLRVILIDASATAPIPLHSNDSEHRPDTSSYLDAFFESVDDVLLNFLLVHQKGTDEACKRVGVFKFKMYDDDADGVELEVEERVEFSRERIELI